MLTATLLAAALVVAPETRLTPHASFSGANSQITTAKTMLINNQAEWNQVWRKHKGWTDATKEAQKFDFKRFWIVGVTMGSARLCRGYITSPAPYGVWDGDKKTTIRIKPNWRYTLEREEEKAPYLFLVIGRKPSKPIELIIDDARENGEKPKWRTLVTLNR